MKRYSFLITLLIISIGAFGQSGNILRNGSFENGGAITAVAQMKDRCDEWETRTEDDQGIPLHSPDYSSEATNVNFDCTRPNGAQDGARYAGLSNYELIQQSISPGTNPNPLVPFRHYTVSFWVQNSYTGCLQSGDDSYIKVFLARHRVKYENENSAGTACQADYRAYESPNPFLDIAEFQISNIDFPHLDGWVELRASFQAPENIDIYDWFVIDVRHNNYTGQGGTSLDCLETYVWIDNIRFEKAEQCASPCSPDLPPVVVSERPNAMIADHYGPVSWDPNEIGGPWVILVENAIGISFVLWNRWGEPIYRKWAFDVNGLVDPGYTDYQFFWTGHKDDGTLFPEDVYDYQLRVWNCDDELFETSGLTYLIGNGYNNPFVPDIQNFDLFDCCPDQAMVQGVNVGLGGFDRVDVNEVIQAGELVDPNSPSGVVTIQSGGEMWFSAEEDIYLEDGFEAEPGAEFRAVLTECTNGPRDFRSTISRRLEDLAPINEAVVSHSSVSVYPNPTDGKIVITGLDEEQLVSVKVMSVVGQTVFAMQTIGANLSSVDLSEFTSGVYIIEVSDGKQILYNEKIIKQ